MLVDAQLCIVKDIKVRIDESYGYGVAALREKQQHQHQHQQEAKQAKLEGRKEQAAGTSSSAGEKEKVTVASATVTPATATVPATPKEAENPLLIRPIGQDTREYLWFRIDGECWHFPRVRRRRRRDLCAKRRPKPRGPKERTVNWLSSDFA